MHRQYTLTVNINLQIQENRLNNLLFICIWVLEKKLDTEAKWSSWHQNANKFGTWHKNWVLCHQNWVLGTTTGDLEKMCTWHRYRVLSTKIWYLASKSGTWHQNSLTHDSAHQFVHGTPLISLI